MAVTGRVCTQFGTAIELTPDHGRGANPPVPPVLGSVVRGGMAQPALDRTRPANRPRPPCPVHHFLVHLCRGPRAGTNRSDFGAFTVAYLARRAMRPSIPSVFSAILPRVSQGLGAPLGAFWLADSP